MGTQKLENIIGFKEVIEELKSKNINVGEVDINIASVIFYLINENPIQRNRDMDGITDKNVEAFIYDDKIASLINSFPKAAAIILHLDTKKNFGFYDEKGKEERAGMMGEYNPIYAARLGIVCYMDPKSRKDLMFNSMEEYQAFKDKQYNERYGFGDSDEELNNENANFNM